jgi:hypothetical protein
VAASEGNKSQVNGEGAQYRAFLLRCWQEAGEEGPSWRFTLVEAGTEGSKQGFADLEAVLDYLKRELG